MGIHSLNAVTGFPYTGQSGITDGAELDSAFSGLTGGDFEAKHMKASTTGVITKGGAAPASPTVGDQWDNGTTVFRYGSSGWVPIGSQISATAPSTTVTGIVWRDTTLGISRVYTTIDGITGWHPVAAGLQLWTNKSGVDVDAGRSVVLESSNSTAREFTTTTTVKDQTVVGVTLESIADDEVGVIAVVESGAVVDLHVLGLTHGAVAAGDVLVTASTAGAARTAGPQARGLTIAPVATSGSFGEVGVQMGGFAVALEGTSLDETIRVRLLGSVGTGMRVFVGKDFVAANTNLTATSSYAEVGLDSTAGIIKNSDHVPLVAATMTLHVQCGINGAAAVQQAGVTLKISNEQDDTHCMTFEARGQTPPQPEYATYDTTFTTTLVDDTTDPTAFGEHFAWKCSTFDLAGTGSGANADVTFYVREYVC